MITTIWKSFANNDMIFRRHTNAMMANHHPEFNSYVAVIRDIFAALNITVVRTSNRPIQRAT